MPKTDNEAYPITDAAAKKMKTDDDAADEIHAVPKRVQDGAHIVGMHNYLSKWEQSVNDPQTFWAKEAAERHPQGTDEAYKRAHPWEFEEEEEEEVWVRDGPHADEERFHRIHSLAHHHHLGRLLHGGIQKMYAACLVQMAADPRWYQRPFVYGFAKEDDRPLPSVQ